jgi:putative transposase
MVIDVNFDSVILAIVVLNSGLIKLKRFRTPPREILTHNIWIERIQKRYSKSWSFAWSIKRFIKKHSERIGNIFLGLYSQGEDLIAELVAKHSSSIVLEDLVN